MSHRGEDGGDGSDVDGSGGGLLTCCTSAGLPPPPPPPQPLLLHLLAPPARRTAVETSAGRSSDRRSDACPDVSRPGRMSVTRREKGASDQAAPASIPSSDRSFLSRRPAADSCPVTSNGPRSLDIRGTRTRGGIAFVVPRADLPSLFHRGTLLLLTPPTIKHLLHSPIPSTRGATLRQLQHSSETRSTDLSFSLATTSSS